MRSAFSRAASAPAFIVLILVSAVNVFAQGGGRPTPTPALPKFSSYAEGIAAAKAHFSTDKLDLAKASYESAALMAADDEQRADAYFGIADVERKRTVKYNLGGKIVEKPDYYGAIREFEKAASLKSVSAVKKRKAYEGVIVNAIAAENPFKAALTYDAMIRSFPDMPANEKVGLLFKKAEIYPRDNAQNANYAYGTYEAITKVAGVGDVDKAKALTAMGDLQYTFGNRQGAYQSYSLVTLTSGATAEQRATATLLSGKMLWELGQKDQAKAMIAKVLTANDASAENKAKAHFMLAQSFEQDKDPAAYLAELAKVPSLKGVSDQDKALAYYSMGAHHLKANAYPAARTEFKKIFSLKGAKNNYVAGAYLQTGKAFEGEKNLKEARAAWTKMAAIAESPVQKSEAFGAIAASYLAEKKYADARKAIADRLAIADLAETEKEDALLALGEVYMQEKNFAAAAESYEKAFAVNPSKGKPETRLRALTGAAEASKAMPDVARQGRAFAALGDFASRSTMIKKELRDPAAKAAWDAAEAFSANDATLDAALVVYDGLMKGNQYVIETANKIHLAAGDILLKKKRPQDAKARFEKVTVGSFANNASLKAQVEQAKQRLAAIQ